ncbi:MAG: carbonic anhydrase [Leptospiraceae bacterium]|nr:carbonic anhydrase [Leptospiraceae bacterium]
MDAMRAMLEGNREWAEKMARELPDLFETLGKGQKPEFLWIGCSDSRIPANVITDAPPGSIFVHRNIANQVVPTDTNMLSVLYFALHSLKVKHIIVCGHYDCGGVRAALSDENQGFLEIWLTGLRDQVTKHRAELERVSGKEREYRLAELNVMQQVHKLSNLPFIREVWKSGKYPFIHGVIYDVSNGHLKDLNVTVSGESS